MMNKLPISALRSWSQDFTMGSFFLWFFVLFLAVFLGLAAAIIPPIYLLILSSLPIAIGIAITLPTAALVFVLIVSFGLLPQFLFANIPLGGATIKPGELILLLVVFLTPFKDMDRVRQAFRLMRPLLPALMAFTFAVGLAFFQGKMLSNFKYAGADLRHYIAWLVLPLSLYLMERQGNVLHRIVMGIGLIAAAGMTFQLLTGIQVIYGFRGSEELSKNFDDVKRSALGGGELFLFYVALHSFGRLCELRPFNFRSLLQLILSSVALVASFSRSLWIGFLVSWLIFLMLSPRLSRSKYLYTLVFSILAIGTLTAVSVVLPRVGDAVIERVESITNEGQKGSSLGFRFDENSQAWSAIRRHPITGMGMGAEYKEVYRQDAIGGGFDTETSFIHNAYLGLWLKTGLLGVLFPFAIMLAMWRHIVRTKHIHTGNSSTQNMALIQMVSAFSSIVGFAFSGITAPIWMSFVSISAIACLVAITLRSGMNTAAKTSRKNKFTNHSINVTIKQGIC